MRPLYQLATLQPTDRDLMGNAGLWFDKFCNQWHVEESSWSMAADGKGNNPKLDWIKSLNLGKAVGMRKQLEECAIRQVRLVQSRAGQFAVFKTETRFVTGLGRSHPIENGFAWHPTLGTPYLPGSSIKGLLRSWVLEWAEPLSDLAMLARLFGDCEKSGAISFLDAIPIQPVSLEADVITPHYADWSELNPPGDWKSPKPIPFLATAVGMEFFFGVVPRAPLQRHDLETLFGWFESALAWTGAGAKTAVGYGRFVRDDKATNRLLETVRGKQEQLEAQRREAVRQASLDPFELELEGIACINSSISPYLVWLNEVVAGRWKAQADSERRVLERVQVEMEKAKKWKPSSNKKNPEKDREHLKTLQVLQLLKQAGNG